MKCPRGCPWQHQPTHWHYKNMKKCNCVEMTCKKGCANNHTHKSFSCDECKVNLIPKEAVIELLEGMAMPPKSAGWEESQRTIKLGQAIKDIKNL